MSWIPRDALAVLRLPKIGDFAAFEQTAFLRALAKLDLDVAGKLAEVRDKLFAEVPVARDVWGLLQGLEGEAVVGIVRVFPASLMGRGNGQLPMTAVAYVDVAGQEEAVASLFSSLEGREFKNAGERRWVMDMGPGRVEVRIADGWLTAYASPRGMTEGPEQWRGLPLDRSFQAAHVVSGAPEVGAKEVAYLEGFLNLEPVWTMVRAVAPPEAQGIISSLKLESLHGLSVVSSIDGERFSDKFTVHSNGDDVLSRVLSQPPLDKAWGGRVRADADTAAVVSFDLDRTFGSVIEMLSGDLRRGLDGWMGQMKRETGFELRKDVLSTFGPHWVLSMRGDPVGAVTRGADFDASLTVQVSNEAMAKKLIDKALKGLRSFGLPGWFDLQYEVVDGAVVLWTSDAATEPAQPSEAPAGSITKRMREALEAAPKGTWAYTVRSTAAELQMLHGLVTSIGGDDTGIPSWESIEAIVKDLPPGETFCRSVPEGFRVESRTVVPNLLMGAAPLAVVSAVAVPNLLESRRAANEAAAIATLRNLVSAQAQFQAAMCSDRDMDGTGEYGFLAEMAGAKPLPHGTELNPPVLSNSFGDVKQGKVVKSGYVFRVWLGGAGGKWLGEAADGGSPKHVHADSAETAFVIYAWPRLHGETGMRAFMVDQRGDILMTDNVGQRYAGLDEGPAPDAARKDGGRWTPVQ